MQIAAFLLALFTFTWTWGIVTAPLVASARLGPFLASLLPTVWAPTAIAIFMLWRTGGATLVRHELRDRVRYRRGTAGWLLLASAVPIAASVLAVVLARRAGDTAPLVPAAAVPIAIALQVMTGAVGEELGWRGYLLPRLRARFGEPAAMWTMGTLWSVWHLPAFFTPGMPHQFFPKFWTLLFIALFGVFLATVFFRAGTSIIATIAAHLSLNIMSALGGVQLSSVTYWRTLAITFGVLAAVSTMWSIRRRVHPLPSGQVAHSQRESLTHFRAWASTPRRPASRHPTCRPSRCPVALPAAC